ncbi:hypothetical protein NC652_028697 [Populus alba x Populus x berolinensis]|nr:hypothetical protein NC652_028697 [Populus alba x Populus x berolinensis]
MALAEKKQYNKVLSIAHKVDRRTWGREPLPSDAKPEEKEEDHTFPVYSARSQQDMDVMVSALAQGMQGDDIIEELGQRPWEKFAAEIRDPEEGSSSVARHFRNG